MPEASAPSAGAAASSEAGSVAAGSASAGAAAGWAEQAAAIIVQISKSTANIPMRFIVFSFLLQLKISWIAKDLPYLGRSTYRPTTSAFSQEKSLLGPPREIRIKVEESLPSLATVAGFKVGFDWATLV
jgi:hypothetical protein